MKLYNNIRLQHVTISYFHEELTVEGHQDIGKEV